MAVKISLTTLKKQVEDGMKKSQLAEYYGMSELQVGKLLKQAGLKIRKFHKPVFELVNDENLSESIKKEEPELDFQPVSEVVESISEEATVKEVVEPENLFSSTTDDKEETIIFEDSSVEKVEEDEDPLFNELVK